jgi:ATP-dependent DNA helicase PIF1
MVNIELSPEQKTVFKAVLDGKNVLVTGSAGTGKSTLLQALLKKWPFDLHVTASTGIAAVNVFGRTIHSWGGIFPDTPIEEIISQVTMRKGGAAARIKQAKMLAVDEISMVDASLLETMDRLFQAIRKDNRPFGGIQLVLFGDFLQLPPVRGTGFAFESQSWKSANIETHRLTKVFRQEDQEFSSVLNEVRIGNITQEISAFLKQRKGLKPSKKIKPVVVYSHNADVDAENEKMLKKLKTEEFTWKARDYGDPGPLKNIQKNCLAPETLRLKVGAQVMCLWNIAPEDGIANGSIGIVKSITDDIPTVQFANGIEMEMERKDWQCKDQGKIIAGRSQIPLRLAYSITAHKCQGMTLDSIEVFLDKCFDYGQAYVALSRCRTIEGLYIGSIDVNRIAAHPKALEFYGH